MAPDFPTGSVAATIATPSPGDAALRDGAFRLDVVRSTAAETAAAASTKCCTDPTPLALLT